jgi:hypothetical protein
MESELLEFKRELLADVEIDTQFNEMFAEESFFTIATEQLTEAGVLDDVVSCFYVDTQKGLRIDGFSWNPLESTFCAVVTRFSGDPEQSERLSQGDVLTLAKRPKRFLESLSNPKFLQGIDPSTDAYTCAKAALDLGDEILKFRVVVITDCELSDRVRSLKLDPINQTSTSVEIWDLNRFHGLALSESDSEPFEISADILGESGLTVMRGATLPTGATAYLGVMPAEILSRIYDEFGQRLLEGNVRTFLDFRGGINRGLRETLVIEPENFFAYNNGITLTADSAVIASEGDVTKIKSLKNLQIVNGGQTTAAIYFAPREKGGIKTPDGEIPFRSIDLSKVSVQMKLTIFEESEQETMDLYRSKISKYANKQNSLQDSDFVSNHPIHLNIERLSRQILMPADSTGLACKWFYERTRGQYSTRLRALKGSFKSKFQIEFPKQQLFTKTDMAKYENTWRMKPHAVKRGAQANLKALGPALVSEFDKNPTAFEGGYFRELVSKAILFRVTDKAVLKSVWYKEESGLKAEAVTFGIALARHKLRQDGKDINLDRIFNQQGLSEGLCDVLVESARIVRNNINSPSFRGGVGNPSEFCKSENGWKRIQTLGVPVDRLKAPDILEGSQVDDAKSETKALDKTSQSVTDFELIFSKGADYWSALASHNLKKYRLEEIQVGVPLKCAVMIQKGVALSPRQLKAAIKIMNDAETAGFSFYKG